MNQSISTLFDPFFTGVNKGIATVNTDLEHARKILSESQAQIEAFKKEANEFSLAIQNLETQAANLRAKVHYLC
jgi:uncharacterized coiled-coil DUF342 family protein